MLLVMPMVAIVSACQAAPVAPEAPQSAILTGIWMTTADGGRRLERVNLDAAPPGDRKRVDVAIDTGERSQKMIGVGAAMTDASAILFQEHLSADQRSELFRELFDPDTGLGLSFTRVVIGASDFSSHHYSLDDTPDNHPDPNLEHFSFEPMEVAVLPMMKEALQINPELVVMATPWSPPAWMKTSDSLIKGTLRADAYGPFSDYLVKSIERFEAAGVPVDYISLQNEPDFEPADYPGMRLSAEQRADLIGNHVGPAFLRAGLRTKILDWDHNWDQPQQPLEVLSNREAAAHVSGVAWHCYAGEVSAQELVRQKFPEKDVFFTECSGGEWSKEWPDAWSWMMTNLVIGAPRNWARGVLLWNLALDENHGPHLGGCSDCRGVVTIDSETSNIRRNAEYYALAHYSRFVEPDAYRVGVVLSDRDLEAVAFQNPDESVALIAFNSGQKDLVVGLQIAGKSWQVGLGQGAAITALIELSE
jgi:glucosylceramidase